MKILELKRKEGQLAKELREMLEKAGKENRALTAEERATFDAKSKEADEVHRQVEDAERLEEIERRSAVGGTEVRGADIGLTDRETKRFSVIRAINALANKGDWRGAEFEKEACDAVAKRIGRTPRGFFVPDSGELRAYPNGESLPGISLPGEVQARYMHAAMFRAAMQHRDMMKGISTQGGYLVSEDLYAASFIELLRNRMVVREAGAYILGDLVGDVLIPKQTGGATGYWVNPETTAVTESTPYVGQVPLKPKTVGGVTDISRTLLKQSSIDVEGFVRLDLVTVLQLAIDLASFHGIGAAGQPLGIAATSGIGSVAGGTNGLAPTWAHIISLETEVAVDNADIGRLAYITNAQVRGKLKRTLITATYGDVMIWDSRSPGTPLNGYKTLVTNQVSSALTKGTSDGVCSAIFFGNWADLIIAMWGTTDILVDPYKFGDQGTVRVIAMQDVDMGVRHAESFSAMLDALTT